MDDKPPFKIIDAKITIRDTRDNAKVTFDHRHIKNIEITVDTKNKYQLYPLKQITEALKLQELVKQSTKAGHPPIVAGYLLQLIAESEEE